MVELFFGIDPGASGGLASIEVQYPAGLLEPLGPRLLIVANKMPSTERDIFNWFDDYDLSNGSFAVIERVGGYVRGNPTPGSAMFKFGAGYGGLRMALIACGIPFDEVTPQKWQRALGIAPRGKTETKSKFKARLKQKAQQLFPTINVDLATADGLLIAEYCRRTYKLRTQNQR